MSADDKLDKKKLNGWLKQQSRSAKRELMFTLTLSLTAGGLIVVQAALLATILHHLIIEHQDKHTLTRQFIGLLVCVLVRSLCLWGKEQMSYRYGEVVRQQIREAIFAQLRVLGPAYIKGKPAGVWASLLLEQVDDMQDFFARYLPQMILAVFIPLIILVVVFPINWAAGLIFLLTAPLVPLFMALVGMKAAEANQRNVKALQRLSGYFYDRLQALSTIRLFNRQQAEAQKLENASEVLRERIMEVLRLAFLSSTTLEFFTSLSIALTAVYFGFSYLGDLDFGHYDSAISLFTGLFILILAPEFYQPLRDLGTFYHAKAQAIAAAQSIVEFLETSPPKQTSAPTRTHQLAQTQSIEIEAKDLVVMSPEGKPIIGPLSFSIAAGQTVALVGESGAGKTSLLNALLGFLPYQGQLLINGQELHSIDLASWYQQLQWLGQNPLLLYGSIADNLTFGQTVEQDQIWDAIRAAHAQDFVEQCGLDYIVGDRAKGLSVGQTQRLALARAILKPGVCWLLDEPTASLDQDSKILVNKALMQQWQQKTAVVVTHHFELLNEMDHILVIDGGKIVQSGHYQEISGQGKFAQLEAAYRAGLNALDWQTERMGYPV